VGIDPATPNDCTWSDNAGLFVVFVFTQKKLYLCR